MEIGNFVIHLPDENSRQFYIFQDLAELFGREYQADAVSALKKAIQLEEDLKPKPSIDYEADKTSIRTSSAETIYSLARIIETLTIPEYQAELNDNQWTVLLENLKSWKRPKPKKWNKGDVFSIILSDGSYAFGQVLKKPEKSIIPTLALFDIKSETENIELDILKNAEPITILHLLDSYLNTGRWRVIGNLEKILCDPSAGPWGKVGTTSGSPTKLESVANYYWFKTHNYNDESQLTELIMKKGNWLNKIKKYWS